MQFGYQNYYGRVDKLVLLTDGTMQVIQGVPSKLPKAPDDEQSAMTIAVLALPPYLYDVDDVSVYHDR